jgi:hypothetical protein
VGFFLNPVLVDRAAAHLRAQRAAGRKRLPDLGSLVLLLNACHAAASGGQVRVSQAYLAARCGGVGARWARAIEAELVAAGLLLDLGRSGNRRVLGLVEARATSPQVIHNQQTPTAADVAVGDPAPVVPATQRRYGPRPPKPPNKDRARVSQGEDSRIGADAAARLGRYSASLARSVAPDRATAVDLGRAVGDLARALGPEAAGRALGEVEAWVRGEARTNPAELAVQALRARARHAQPPRVVQRSLYP